MFFFCVVQTVIYCSVFSEWAPAGPIICTGEVPKNSEKNIGASKKITGQRDRRVDVLHAMAKQKANFVLFCNP